MPVTLAFDVYGTLIDTHGLVTELQQLIGDNAQAFSQTWREKQLEYSFRRGLMQTYEPFSVCTRHALDYSCMFHEVDITEKQRKQLLERYRSLPAFDDAKNGLEKLKANNYRLFAFSNGTADAVNELLVAANIRDYFQGVVSVDEIKSFKPNPAVYDYFLRVSGAEGTSTWLISSNPFDVIGAISAGWCAAWVQRSKQVIYDPWDIEPTITIDNLETLNDKLVIEPS